MSDDPVPEEKSYQETFRAKISEAIQGKTVASMTYYSDGDYWVITFTTEEQLFVRLLGEIPP